MAQKLKERTDYDCYYGHKKRAEYSGIAFEFSFPEWVNWWVQQLGPNWRELRGRKGHQFCMARNGDKGSYSESNVHCTTNSGNCAERGPNGVIKGTKNHHGVKNPRCRLTEEQVISIFTEKGTYKSLAPKYGVSWITIRDIKKQFSWKQLTSSVSRPQQL